MRQNISSLYDAVLAQMASEAYLEDPNPGNSVIARSLRQGNNRSGFGERRFVRFTESQIQQFLSKYGFVDQLSDNPLGSAFRDTTGLSATLLRKLDANHNPLNEYVLSIRSTEFPNANQGGDWERDGSGGADGAILRTGYALAQLASLEDYYSWLKNTGLLPADAMLSITGYSLGGHLATVFTELHEPEIAQTVIFNGAGRGGLNRSAPLVPGVERSSGTVLDLYRAVLADPGAHKQFLQRLRLGDVEINRLSDALNALSPQLFTATAQLRDGNVYGNPRHRWAATAASQLATSGAVRRRTGLSAAADAKIVDVFGHATHDDAEGVAAGGIRASTRQQVFIEDQPDFSGFGGIAGSPGDFGNTHSLTLIADSLALMRGVQGVDPALDQPALQAIFASASNLRGEGTLFVSGGRSETDSLENVLDALRRLFVDPDAKPTQSNPRDGGFGDLANRNRFFERLGELEEVVARAQAEGVRFRIVPFVSATQFRPDNGEPFLGAMPMRADEFFRLAGEDSMAGAAYRYALRELNPFAVLVEGGTLEAYRDRSLDPLDEAEGLIEGRTPEYWAERAALLERKLFANVHNLNNDYLDPVNHLTTSASPADRRISPYAGDEVVIEDWDRNYLFRAQQTPRIGRRVVFGKTDEANTVAASSAADSLFGGDEADELHGGAGSDHLDGGEGADRLFGGDHDDTLAGGAGDDLLDGGNGRNLLLGGSGFDTYVVAASDEVQVIADADGSGQVILDGQRLSGGRLVGGNLYAAADGSGTHYRLVGNLRDGRSTLLVDERLEILDFSNGDLGISLDGAFEAPPQSGFAYVYTSHEWPDGHGNGDPRLEQGSEQDDHFRPSTDEQLYFGKGGNDLFEGKPSVGESFSGGPGDDVIFGGALDDVPGFAPSGDVLSGEAGNDVLTGSPLSDRLSGDFAGASQFESAPGVMERRLGPLWLWNSITSPGHVNVSYGHGVAPRSNFDLAQYNESQQYASLREAFEYAAGEADEAGRRDFDDWIDGGAGNDQIFGGNGSDTLLGGEGNDTIAGDNELSSLSQLGEFAALFGEPGDDYADGGEGNDRLLDKEGGSDTLLGGEGDDWLENQDGAAAPAGQARAYASNFLDGGPGDDTIRSLNGTQGTDVLLGGDGDDAIRFRGPNVHIDAGPGNDHVEVSVGGSQSPSELLGGSGDDEIELELNGSIDDLDPSGVPHVVIRVDAGEGNDSLFVDGEGTADVVLGPGDDEVFVNDLSLVRIRFDDRGRGGVDFDRLVLGSGLSGESDVLVRRIGDELVITPIASSTPGPEAIGSVTISDWFSAAGSGIAEIEFESGATWTRDTVDGLLARRPDVASDDDNVLVGSTVSRTLRAGGGNDRVMGHSGHDLLEGNAGVDSVGSSLAGDAAAGSFLSGGTGEDTLEARSPNDVIAFNRGDGADTVFGAGGGTLSLGGVQTGDITLSRSGDDLLVDLSNGDALAYRGWFADEPGEAPFRLQIVSPRSVAVYDLKAALDRFWMGDEAGSDAAAWAPGSSWPTLLLETSLDSAIGGRLAYEYAAQGTTRDLADSVVASVLSDARFGREQQPLELGRSLNEFLVAPGVGVVTVDSSTGVDGLRFAEGIVPGAITLELGSLVLRLGDSGDEVHLAEFDPENAFRAGSIASFRFSDGTTLSYEQLIARGFDLIGTDADDVIVGTNAVDRIQGGPGNDLLKGGAGNDTYIFGRGSGTDTIEDLDAVDGNSDAIRFVGDLSIADIELTQADGSIVFSLRGSNDRLTVRWRPEQGYAVETLEFGDGTRLSTQALISGAVEVPPPSPAPVPTQPTIEQGTPAATPLPATVADSDPGSGGAAASQPADGAPPSTGTASPPALPAVEVILGTATGVPSATPRSDFVDAPISWFLQTEPNASALALPASAQSSQQTVVEFTSSSAQLPSQERVGVPLDPLFREMQQRFDVLLQVGRTNLSERYAEAVREFEERRERREEAPAEPAPPTEEEIAAWNRALHAWHERNPGFGEIERDASGAAWTLGWSAGIGGERGLDFVADASGAPGLANPHALARFFGVAQPPGLAEGLRVLR